MWHWWTEISQVILIFLHLALDLLHDFWKRVLDVSEQDLCQLSSQVSNTEKVLLHGGVDWMTLEVELLLFDGFLDRDSIDDILLGPVLDTDEP